MNRAGLTPEQELRRAALLHWSGLHWAALLHWARLHWAGLHPAGLHWAGLQEGGRQVPQHEPPGLAATHSGRRGARQRAASESPCAARTLMRGATPADFIYSEYLTSQRRADYRQMVWQIARDYSQVR